MRSLTVERRIDGSLPSDVEVMSTFDKIVYSPEEVAHLLGLHQNSIYSMLKSGALPGIKAGRRWLISKQRLEVWLSGESA